MPRKTILALAAIGFLAPASAQAATQPPELTPIHVAHAREGAVALVDVHLLHRARRQVTVDYRTINGTARAGRDYEAAHGTFVIPKGKRHGTIAIHTIHDHVDEHFESFFVRLSNPHNARLGNRRSAIVHVLDDNAIIATVGPRTIKEPVRAGTSVRIGAVVTLHGGSAGEIPVDVGYEVLGVESTLDSHDADLGSGVLHFAVGQKRKVIPGRIYGDTFDEDDEHLLVVLTGSRGVYARPGATIRIIDSPNDTPPVVTIGNLTAPEGEGGAAQVPLTLSAPSERHVSVTYTLTAGSADGSDYVVETGTASFQPDTVVSAVPVALKDDLIDEPDETLTVTISDPIDATLGSPASATLTIADDDLPPTVSIGDGTVTEPATSATLPLILSQPSAFAVSVKVAITGATAQVGDSCGAEQMDPVDVLAIPADLVISFPPGTTLRTLDLTTCEDTSIESAANVLFGLSDPVNATLGDASGQLNVLDND